MSLFQFTSSIPAANDYPGDDQPLMQQNFASTANLVAIDHVGFNTASTGGYHNKSTYVSQGSDPSAVAGTDIVYSKLSANSTQEVFVRKPTGAIFELSLIKVYVLFTFTTPSTIAIADQQNVASVTVGGGNITVTFTNALANTNYSIFGAIGAGGFVLPGLSTLTTGFSFTTPGFSQTYGIMVLQS